MTVYNINLGIGWASSGVEYAQIYRAKALRDSHIPAKFIFMDMIQHENIQHLTANIGFKDTEVIWLYQHFSDIKIAPTTYTVEQLLATIPYKLSRTENSGKTIRYFYDEEQFFVTAYLTKEGQHTVDRAEFVSRGCLIRKDYYSYTRVFSEYYAPKNESAHLYHRRFFNEDGSVAYDELIDGEQSIFKMPDTLLYSKADLIAYFIRSLNLTATDILIMDRATDIAQPIFEAKGAAKVGTIVHAEHYSENMTDDAYILWNNYYEYEFMHADIIDFFVTSTEAQTATLAAQFAKYTPFRPKIYTIPVGGLSTLQTPDANGRKPYSLVTASRLASEKHIDWLVRAVVQAKQTIPALSFDIYGNGGEKERLEQLIQALQAQDYIQLKGHHHLEHVYRQYQAYIAASTSEGFGLTLMEAVGSGLLMIGFDVPYGNPTFIRNGKNGYLIPKESDDSQQLVAQLAQAIETLFQRDDFEQMHWQSYEIGSRYLSQSISEKWASLVEEVLHD